MSYSGSTSSIPFRSKKPNVEQQKEAKALSPKATVCTTSTPEKTSQLPKRTRNRGVALSLKEVRKVAESLQQFKNVNQENERPERPKSARRQINMSSMKSKEVDGSTNLPQKYELLSEFFDGLDSSIRLLRLKGSVPSFTKIYPQIECLTDRRFTHGHLAQLKFILPEVLEIKKVLTFEERTSCMKPDLHIAMSADGIKSHGNLASEGGPMSLRKLFRARLTDFLKLHPEIDEIPKHPLPEPFDHSRNNHQLEMVIANASDSRVKQPLDTSSKAIRGLQAAASHLSPSFRRRFSQKHSTKKVDNVPANVIEDCARHPDFSVPEPFVRKDFSNGESGSSFSPISEKISASCSKDAAESTDVQLDTPVKTLHSKETTDGLFSNMAYSESTPAKVDSTPCRLMSATPGLHPPKRSCMSPDSDSSFSPNKLVRRPPRSRSLKFDTPVKNMESNIEDNNASGSFVGDDIHDILPDDLLQSIREKERIAMEELNPAISQAKHRHKMIACLPKLFNMIHMLFHAINRTVLSKEELVHKIISGHCDIIDRREVEEQLNLLLELVPEWICEKRASTGDLLLCINKLSNAESIRALLQEAK